MDTTHAQLQNPSAEANDVFSLSDEVLAEQIDFCYEIGYGNWGSVWLCRTKSYASDGAIKYGKRPLAAKLVFRERTGTAAARVRSLWNEMKIVRTFKSEPHPSIIQFHSFIITPSFAIISMTYLQDLIPVEVPEPKATEWFRSLLSGLEFLHERGVVHNDIKPANILLSYKDVPVLVDFGFAEKYDLESDTAFHSNLSYGTPEYLAPERARGLPHDTRKSDVWSLGVTFFEVLVGRTPFEHADGKLLDTPAELEKYWARTLRGKWLGTWNFSKGMEKLLRRMVAPNADLRCTASQAMKDSFWKTTEYSAPNLNFSEDSSVAFERDIDMLLDMSMSSWKPPLGVCSPQGLVKDEHGLPRKPTLSKSKSQIGQPRKRAPAPPVTDLSPIKASPNVSPMPSATAKENILAFNKLANVVNADKKKHERLEYNSASMKDKYASRKEANEKENAGHVRTSGGAGARRPLGALATHDQNVPLQHQHHHQQSSLQKKPSGNTHGLKAVKVLGELNLNPNATVNSISRRDFSFSFDGDSSMAMNKSKDSTTAKDRVREWERERERLREMERLEELEREREREREVVFRREKRRQPKYEDDVERRESAESRGKESFHVEEGGRPSEDSRKERRSGTLGHIRIPRVGSSSANNREKKSSDWDRDNVASSATSPVLPMFKLTSPFANSILHIGRDTPSSAAKGNKQSGSKFKHSIKASIDKTMQFYKSSITSGRSTPARGLSFDLNRATDQAEGKSSTKDGQDAWVIPDQDGTSLPEISPLPTIKNAAETEQLAADSREDRMAIWMRNVERVVAEAKQNFAMAEYIPAEIALPPPPPPLSRNHSQNRNRLPRRVLAASQIFQSDENGNITPMMPDSQDQSMLSAQGSSFLSAGDISRSSLPSPSQTSAAPMTPLKKGRAPLPTIEGSEASPGQFVIPEIYTPSRQRRATVSDTRSPKPAARAADKSIVEDDDNNATASPSKQMGRSKSHENLLGKPIIPFEELERQINTPLPPPPTPRLCDVIDRSLFIAKPYISRDNLLDADSVEYVRSPSLDDLTSSPCHVEPYPQRVRSSYDAQIPDTPNRHRIENVYDRFLMATSGVKRLGKGYQSDNVGPVVNGSKQTTTGLGPQKLRSHFYSTRRPMPPPVSSDDPMPRAASVDELGMVSQMTSPTSPSPQAGKDESANVTTLMRKAMKMIVPKNNHASKRLSRVG